MTDTETKRPDPYTRNDDGRFAPGTKPGGRLPRVLETKYTEITMRVCTPEIWQQIVERAVKDALSGGVKKAIAARNFLAKYLMPPPGKGPHTGPMVNMQLNTPMPAPEQLDAAIDQRLQQLIAEQHAQQMVDAPME